MSEPMLTVQELAAHLRVSEDTARRLAERMPGAVILNAGTPGKRRYRTIRVPQPVVQRYLEERTNRV